MEMAERPRRMPENPHLRKIHKEANKFDDLRRRMTDEEKADQERLRAEYREVLSTSRCSHLQSYVGDFRDDLRDGFLNIDDVLMLPFYPAPCGQELAEAFVTAFEKGEIASGRHPYVLMEVFATGRGPGMFRLPNWSRLSFEVVNYDHTPDAHLAFIAPWHERVIAVLRQVRASVQYRSDPQFPGRLRLLETLWTLEGDEAFVAQLPDLPDHELRAAVHFMTRYEATLRKPWLTAQPAKHRFYQDTKWRPAVVAAHLRALCAPDELTRDLAADQIVPVMRIPDVDGKPGVPDTQAALAAFQCFQAERANSPKAFFARQMEYIAQDIDRSYILPTSAWEEIEAYTATGNHKFSMFGWPGESGKD